MSSEFAKDSLSLEETNKLRISLGLKPLPSDDAPQQKDDAGEQPPKDKDTIAQENYRNRREQEARQREQDEIRQRIAKAQNKRDLNRQLRGATLGKADDATDDTAPSDSKSTLKWLKQAQKKQKENAAKRAKELEEQEADALRAAESYGESDLSGLRVAHDVEDFDLRDGDEQGKILTLRDSKILDGDEDELMDAAIEQREIDRRNKERKKGPKEYTGLDDEEMDDAQAGRKRGVLSKYDADIQDAGMKLSDGGGFRLGGSIDTPAERKEAKRKEIEEEARRKNRTLLSLDYTKNQEVSDYLSPADVAFKKSKPKKKKRPQASRIKLEQDDEADDGEQASTTMAVDNDDAQPGPSSRRRAAQDTDNLIDDDELAASLAKARRAKAKKASSKMTPEQIAKNLAAQREAEEKEEAERRAQEAASGVSTSAQAGSSSDGMTFDATSEFIRNIANRPSSPEPQSRSRSIVKEEPRQESLPREESPGMQLDDDDDGDAEMEEGAMVSPPPSDERARSTQTPDVLDTSEPSVAGGLSSTLRLLQSQGLIEGRSEEQLRREAAQKSYDAWKARHLAEEALKEEERRLSKLQGSAKDQSTREYENKVRELEEARRAEARFKDYRPDVNIVYHDEHGRKLNNHEAWKLLSHTFHGKMPGRAKQEKYKKKVEEERKRERLAAGDARDMSKVFRERQQREGQAHMVLSVGARGNAPQDFAQNALGPNLVHKRVIEDGSGKGKGTKKKTQASASTASPVASTSRNTPMLSPPLPQIVNQHPAERQALSPAPAPAAVDSPSATSVASPAPAAPRMKPAFAPIGAAAASGGGSSTNTSSGPSVAGSGFKLAFGGASKRKAEEQGGRQ